MLVLNLALSSGTVVGMAVWAVQMLWIPITGRHHQWHWS